MQILAGDVEPGPFAGRGARVLDAADDRRRDQHDGQQRENPQQAVESAAVFGVGATGASQSLARGRGRPRSGGGAPGRDAGAIVVRTPATPGLIGE